MVNFKDALKEHYSDINLSDEQLASLMEAQAQAQASESAHNRDRKASRSFLSGLAVAAIVLLGVFGAYSSIQEGELAEEVAAEMSYNHSMKVRPEVMTSDYIEAAKFLTRLDFSVVVPDRLVKSAWQLIGARYCSVKGKIAARFELKHVASGQLYTLYEAPVPEGGESHFDKRMDLYKKGNHVSLWKEKGLLLGLAGPGRLNEIGGFNGLK